LVVVKGCRCRGGEIHTVAGSLKEIRLSDWVESIPEIVNIQKGKIRLYQEEEKQIRDNKQVQETVDKFDLGKYQ
jgi:hypothetical protein